jgi:endoglucanase
MQSGSVGIVGGAVVPNSAFSNFWYQIASIYKNNPHVIFGLMNEPNAVQETQMVGSENAAIAGIRAAGASNMIFVPGNRWTGAWTWSQSDGYGAANSNAMLNIVDPGNNSVIEVHQYLDANGSGSNDGIVSTDIGWQRLTNFTAWARAYNVKAFLGEYAVPGNTLGSGTNGGVALTNMLSYISTNSDVWLGWTYWGGGPWWGSSPTFPIEPSNIGLPSQQDQPTMSIIKQFFPLPVPTLQIINNNTQFQYAAPQGFVYQVQYSTDLTSSANWVNLGAAVTNVASPGSVGTNAPFTVNLGSDPQGFYRVVVSHAP